MSIRNLRLTNDYHYILLLARSSTSQEIDELAVQQSLKSSLLQTCGQTASTHIDILSLHESPDSSSPNNAQGQVVIRIGPSDRKNVLVAITTSAIDKTRLALSVIRESTFLPSLLPYTNI